MWSCDGLGTNTFYGGTELDTTFPKPCVAGSIPAGALGAVLSRPLRRPRDRVAFVVMDWAALRGIALFAELDESALKRIAALATEFDAPAGQVLAERGQPGAGLLVIETGEITVELPDGRLNEYGPGEFFGEVSLLTDEPRTARVRSRSAVRGIAISRSEFFELLDQEPRIAVAMLPVIARRLANAN